MRKVQKDKLEACKGWSDLDGCWRTEEWIQLGSCNKSSRLTYATF